METLLLKILFGHLIGDFFLQTQTMADAKSKPGWKGTFWCSAHVAVYTSSIALFAGTWSPIFLAGVFIPHWTVDRWSLAYKWMVVIGRGGLMESQNPKEASFGTIIYVVMDQTIHFGCLCLVMKGVIYGT